MISSVSDFLIRIKNAGLAKRRQVVIPFSNSNKAIGEILVRLNFLEELKEEKAGEKRTIKVKLAYDKRKPVLTGIEIISKPSLRVYVKTNSDLLTKRKGVGVSILSTPYGVMTGIEAQRKGVGGELLFKIW